MGCFSPLYYCHPDTPFMSIMSTFLLTYWLSYFSPSYISFPHWLPPHSPFISIVSTLTISFKGLGSRPLFWVVFPCFNSSYSEIWVITMTFPSELETQATKDIKGGQLVTMAPKYCFGPNQINWMQNGIAFFHVYLWVSISIESSAYPVMTIDENERARLMRRKIYSNYHKRGIWFYYFIWLQLNYQLAICHRAMRYICGIRA